MPPYHLSLSQIVNLMDNKFISKKLFTLYSNPIILPRSHATTGTQLLANEKYTRLAITAISRNRNFLFKLYSNFQRLTVDLTSTLLFQIKYLYFLIDLKVIIFANNRIKKMMKLAIIFLPIVFALIWALFIGLRINKVENRDGKRKLINY